jgi:Tfp pilus assembly protein PilN
VRKHHKVNLIPASHKAPPLVSVDQFILVGIFIALLGCGLHFYLSTQRVNSLNNQVSAIGLQAASTDRQIQEMTRLITAGSVVDEQEKLIRQVIGSKPNWADAFKELSLVIPQETWLSQLILKNNSGQIAVSIRGETSSQANMADFLSSLERSEFFNNILMISSKLSEQTSPPLYSFEFAAPSFGVVPKSEATR